MLWSSRNLTPVLLVVILNFFVRSNGQEPDFSAYDTVDQFNCSQPFEFERIILNKRCGTILSPCYPENYPRVVPNGAKFWDLDARQNDNVPVVAYRFILNDFETDLNGGFLDFATRLKRQDVTNSYTVDIDDRILVISGFVDQDLEVIENDTRINEHGQRIFDLNQSRLYLNFYAERKPSQKGFNVSYCADYDKCDSNYSPAFCNLDQSRCERYGFNNYSCIYDEGFTGTNCSNDVNECATSPCHANAQCIDTVGSFTCVCDSGYTGDGRNCTEINECILANPCHQNGSCIDGAGNVTCSCNEGYTGDGINCTNINECEIRPCDVHAICQDTFGSYMCRCMNGYSGNGFSCTDIDECKERTDNCAQSNSPICTNTEGSFKCQSSLSCFTVERPGFRSGIIVLVVIVFLMF